MPILYDNRNQNPENQSQKEVDIDAIFAEADAKIAEQNKKSVFTPKKKKFNFFKSMKRLIIWSIVITIVALIVTGVFAGYKAYHLMKSELKNTVVNTINDLRVQIDEKSEDELTEEEKLLKEMLAIITEDDIQRMIDQATSIEEILNILETENITASDYLTEEQQKQLEELFTEYLTNLEQRIEESEAAETIENTESSTSTDATESSTETIEETIVNETTENIDLTTP